MFWVDNLFVNWSPGHLPRVDTSESKAFDEFRLEHHASHIKHGIWYGFLMFQIINWHRAWQTICKLFTLAQHWNGYAVIFTIFATR